MSSKRSVQRQRQHGWQKLFKFEERPASVRGSTAAVLLLNNLGFGEKSRHHYNYFFFSLRVYKNEELISPLQTSMAVTKCNSFECYSPQRSIYIDLSNIFVHFKHDEWVSNVKRPTRQIIGYLKPIRTGSSNFLQSTAHSFHTWYDSTEILT